MTKNYEEIVDYQERIIESSIPQKLQISIHQSHYSNLTQIEKFYTNQQMKKKSSDFNSIFHCFQNSNYLTKPRKQGSALIHHFHFGERTAIQHFNINCLEYLQFLTLISQFISIFTKLLPKDKEKYDTILSVQNKEKMNQLKQSFLGRLDRINSSPKELKAIVKIFETHFKDIVNSILSILISKWNIIFIKKLIMQQQSNIRLVFNRVNERNHELLKNKSCIYPLLKFSKSKLIGQTNGQPKLIKDKKMLIIKCLNALFSINKFLDSEPITFFFK